MIGATSMQFPLLMDSLGVEAIAKFAEDGTFPENSEGLDSKGCRVTLPGFILTPGRHRGDCDHGRIDGTIIRPNVRQGRFRIRPEGQRNEGCIVRARTSRLHRSPAAFSRWQSNHGTSHRPGLERHRVRSDCWRQVFSAFNLSLIMQQVSIIGILAAAQSLIILAAGIDQWIGKISS